MSNRLLKTCYFVLEGVNSFATVYYSYYLYFYLQETFGFGNKANLAVAALNGFVCMVAAWYGGKFGQRFGYFNALKLGFGVMAVSLATGGSLHTVTGQLAVMVFMIAGMCFTWPNLEALVSEFESPAALARTVGLYNVIWAATSALAYFVGGALLEKLGRVSLFYVPAGIEALLLGFAIIVERRREAMLIQQSDLHPQAQAGATQETRRSNRFVRMAWLANPFGYIAINTLVAVIPGIARKFDLSPMMAGFCCSVWCFARVGAFVALWFWEGWHYRFGWLIGSFAALILSFGALLMGHSLGLLVLSQLVFGAALGLLYSSSLFYSMDGSETKGEHGGIHEAAIGFGNFVGPAVGALSLQWFPTHQNGGAVAVSVLLLTGLGALWVLGRRRELP